MSGLSKLRSGLLLGALAAGLFAAFYSMDLVEQSPRANPLNITLMEPEDLRSALGNLPEVVVALLGIAITVVSILVQLAATRYTPQITGLFLRDKTNVAALGFFTMTTVFCVWVSFAIGRDFVPYTLVLVTLGLISFSILLLVPYFGYVFELVDPERVLERMGDQALALTRTHHGLRSLRVRQQDLLVTIENIAAVGVNSLHQRERVIASRSVTVLRDLLMAYMDRKPTMDTEWFQIDGAIVRNSDFESLAVESSRSLEKRKIWVEWKVLRQLQIIYAETGGTQGDVACQVAITTRQLGEHAMVRRDRHALKLILKYFNTFLRLDINGKRIRGAYNLLHQYRQLAEVATRTERHEVSRKIAEHLLYYAHTATHSGLDFICETVAYDLSSLCELAHGPEAPDQEALRAILLRVDIPPERPEQDRALRGVRKAQVKLATYYLSVGAWPEAREIWQDMAGEPRWRLRSILDELQSVESREFWEVVDRGTNFDFLEEDRREQLGTFFSWFNLDDMATDETAEKGPVTEVIGDDESLEELVDQLSRPAGPGL